MSSSMSVTTSSSFQYKGQTFNAEPPRKFFCSISDEVMEAPAITNCLHTFERASITEWMERNKANPTCPSRCGPITSLQDDRNLMNDFQDWRNDHLIEKIDPDQMADYVLHPEQLDNPLTFHAYLRFIKQEKLADQVALCVAGKVKNVAEIPNLQDRTKPERFEQIAWEVLSTITCEAQELCIRTTNPNQLAVYVFHPENLPEANRETALNAYLKVIKKEGLVKEVALCIANMVKDVAELPDFQKLSKPKQIDLDAWITLSKILQRAQRELSARVSPTSSRQPGDDRISELLDTLTLDVRQRQEAEQRRIAEAERERQEQLEREQRPLSYWEMAKAIITVLAPIVLPMAARATASVVDTDPDTTILSESFRFSFTDVPSALQTVSAASEWSSEGNAGARKLSKQMPTQLISASAIATRDYTTTMARDSSRIDRLDNQQLRDKIDEHQGSMKEFKKECDAHIGKVTQDYDGRIDALNEESNKLKNSIKELEKPWYKKIW